MTIHYSEVWIKYEKEHQSQSLREKTYFPQWLQNERKEQVEEPVSWIYFLKPTVSGVVPGPRRVLGRKSTRAP